MGGLSRQYEGGDGRVKQRIERRRFIEAMRDGGEAEGGREGRGKQEKHSSVRGESFVVLALLTVFLLILMAGELFLSPNYRNSLTLLMATTTHHDMFSPSFSGTRLH